MGAVNAVVTGLYAEVEAVIPEYKKAAHVWIREKNTDKKPTIAVRPGSGASTAGTNRAVTIDQSFELELTRTWKPQAGLKGTDLDAQILQMQEDHEKVWKKIFQRRFNADPSVVLVVSAFDISSPEVDNENNTVSLLVTYQVVYRSETT